ncbi:MAG: hypothetical protein IPK39_18720 [Sulfuritalea sp.]|nr:hypothetical protein [Sulfuritalea sp.]
MGATRTCPAGKEGTETMAAGAAGFFRLIDMSKFGLSGLARNGKYFKQAILRWLSLLKLKPFK